MKKELESLIKKYMAQKMNLETIKDELLKLEGAILHETEGTLKHGVNHVSHNFFIKVSIRKEWNQETLNRIYVKGAVSQDLWPFEIEWRPSKDKLDAIESDKSTYEVISQALILKPQKPAFIVKFEEKEKEKI